MQIHPLLQALLGSRRANKQRKVSFLNALSTDQEEEGAGNERESRHLIGGKCCGGGKVMDENNNVNVYGFSPPSCKYKEKTAKTLLENLVSKFGSLKM